MTFGKLTTHVSPGHDAGPQTFDQDDFKNTAEFFTISLVYKTNTMVGGLFPHPMRIDKSNLAPRAAGRS